MLQIFERRERWLVGAADAALAVVSLARRAAGSADAVPARILLLRLERIGDLIMALPAIRDVRALAPAAEIDLVVGSWNAPLARAVPEVTRVEVVDARWLARGAGGLGPLALLRRAAAWRDRRYDLGINFEPDIRSNLMLAASGARRTAGWRSGGGGPAIDLALDYEPGRHTTDNARRLVAAAFGRTPADTVAPRLDVPPALTASVLADIGASVPRPFVGVHVSGGRAIKQWPPDRFAEVARRLADEHGATIVATGGPGDREMVAAFVAALGSRRVVDASETDDLLRSAALLAQLDLLVTGDTGPMHLAAAVGTPVVAVFGPSDPARYAPSGPRDRVVRVDLPCSPCNRIRQPPARCVGHTPDCLVHVTVDAVYDAAAGALAASAAAPSGAGRS